MEHDDPVTQWLSGLRDDECDAAAKLWQLYWRRVAGMARKVLGERKAGAADEHDVAQSAFRSFFLRAREGRFPRLEDRTDLWNLLVTITIRKAIKQRRRQSRQAAALPDSRLIEDELSREPDPEVAAVLRDEISRLVSLLDESSRRVVAFLLQGCTNEETAERCGVSVATVERKRKLIRETWRREFGS